jgi:hypothetical protein
MPIPNGMFGECCLCSRYFATKTELDAHDRIYAVEHKAALNKGLQADIGKSFDGFDDPLFQAITSTGPQFDMKDALKTEELAKLAEKGYMNSPIDVDSQWNHQHGRPSGYFDKTAQTKAGHIDPMFAHLLKIEGC